MSVEGGRPNFILTKDAKGVVVGRGKEQNSYSVTSYQVALDGFSSEETYLALSRNSLLMTVNREGFLQITVLGRNIVGFFSSNSGGVLECKIAGLEECEGAVLAIHGRDFVLPVKVGGDVLALASFSNQDEYSPERRVWVYPIAQCQWPIDPNKYSWR